MTSEKESPDKRDILIFNSGSSSIKFAIYDIANSFALLLKGEIERIGLTDSCIFIKDVDSSYDFSKIVKAPDHLAAIRILINFVKEYRGFESLSAIGHRVVHGGPKLSAPARVTPQLIKELRKLATFDPEHMPEEILLIEEFQKQFPNLPQAVCFDTAFHHDMPRVAQIISIPRKYEALGVRRYGFHGLSYSFIVKELRKLSGKDAANSRLIIAHLGNGASLAAVREGNSFDTTMSFTPTSGIPMGTRSGDLDPGLVSYLSTQGIDAKKFSEMVSFHSGLLGISETSSDMRDLLKIEKTDSRAAEAVNLFCYQVKKSIGAFAAALGGIDALVFTGGIGENAPSIRWRICDNLKFLGIEIEPKTNITNDKIISTSESRVVVRVMHTDEELMIAELIHEGNLVNSNSGELR